MNDEPRRRLLEPSERQALLRRASAAVVREPEAAAAWLHGSVARGEPARDVDLAVLPRPGADPWRVAERLAGILEREVAVGLPWDVRPVTSTAEPAFRFEVLREGIRIAENDPGLAATFWVDAVRDYLDVEPLLRRTRRAFVERMAHGS